MTAIFKPELLSNCIAELKTWNAIDAINRCKHGDGHLVNALAELAALGVAFISLRDNLDLSTPSGRLMFQIIGAMAEFERALIQERVRAGLRNARAKGRRLGRPRVIVDASRIASLRAQGRFWSEITAEMKIG